MSKLVSIQGRITNDTSGQMRRTLAHALHTKPAQLTVDLSEVPYIDTSGLATLVEAARIAREQGTRLVLDGLHGQVHYIFKISKLDHLFEITGPEASV